jgi:phosphohistidine phosphatase
MLVLLIRHAIAAAQDQHLYPDDALRPLTPKGRRIQRRVSARLFDAGLAPGRVFSSPWKRAWQTARIVVDETGIGKERRIRSDALARPPDLGELAEAIGEVGSTEKIALVGHEPWMSGLAALLLTGGVSGLAIDFPKSGIMAIDADALEPGAGALQFFWRP